MARKNNSPFQLLYNKPPTLLHLKSFGCLAFASTLHVHRTKFDSRARKTVFLGFRNGTKGYLLYDLHSHEFVISRNVIFYETTFPLHIPSPPQTTPPPPHIDLPEPDLEPLIPPPTTTPPLPYVSPPTNPTTNPSPPLETAPLRQSTRTSRPPSYLKDYHCNLLTNHSTTTVTSNDHLFPLYGQPLTLWTYVRLTLLFLVIGDSLPVLFITRFGELPLSTKLVICYHFTNATSS